MGKVNLPTVVQKGTSGPRKPATRDPVGKAYPTDDEKSTKSSATTANHSAKVLLPAVQSDHNRMAQARRATVSFVLPSNHGHTRTIEMTYARSRRPSTPPPARTSVVPDSSQIPPRPVSPLLRGTNLQHPIQDRSPSILECLYNSKGDAQASPPDQQDAKDASPIGTAARHVQELGRSARAEALPVVGMLLKRVCQQKIDKEEIRNVFFMTCTDIFARDPLDNPAGVSFAFQLLCILVQEEIMQGSDFVKAATMLAEEGHHDGCKLLVQLALDGDKLKFAANEIETLTDIATGQKPDQNKGKAKA